MNADDVERMREASGAVKDDDKLVCFIYSLGRDHLSLGDIEGIMSELRGNSEYVYTNGWLARYAQDVANRLRSSAVTNLDDTNKAEGR